MAAPSVTGVELGFAEETSEKHKLTSPYFPSKIGGKPAWLDLKSLPGIKQLTCKKCDKPCVFLLQVYAPWNEKPSCFHRTLFLFICKNPKCNKSDGTENIIAFRSQLTKVNDYYSAEGVPDIVVSTKFDNSNLKYSKSLCDVCGCHGNSKCAKCKKSTYCCRDHQVIGWKTHKTICGKDASEAAHRTSNPLLFPEYELVTEPEDYEEGEEKEDRGEKSEHAKLQEYDEYVKESTTSGASLLEGKTNDTDLAKMAMGDDQVDAQFTAFRARTNLEPDQVLRYQRGGVPLWVATEGQPSDADIPNCHCGAKRTFEFQILPQLLNHLEVDELGESLDWGTLVVYTCTESCQPADDVYQPEWVWKQKLHDCEIKR